MFAEAGETETEATGAGGGAVTVIVAVPVLDSLVAAIVADPALTAATRPVLAFTDAIPVFEVDHVTTRPVNWLLLASSVTAES
jgi:hypothetical protein